ncbi:MAG TPA: DUF2147 domain-containing protein [Steroidobacteraceae bacterium]
MKITGVLSSVILFVSLAAAALVAASDAQQARIIGNWLTQSKDGIIQIAQGAGGSYEGRIVGGNQPGRLDAKNPDPALRDKPLRGAVILRALHYDGDGKWSGGAIYEPDTGRTYKCLIELAGPDTIKVHGYIGIALLGKSQLWTRYLGTAMDPPATH